MFVECGSENPASPVGAEWGLVAVGEPVPWLAGVTTGGDGPRLIRPPEHSAPLEWGNRPQVSAATNIQLLWSWEPPPSLRCYKHSAPPELENRHQVSAATNIQLL